MDDRIEYVVKELIDRNDNLFFHLLKFTNGKAEFIIETRSVKKLLIKLHECLRTF